MCRRWSRRAGGPSWWKIGVGSNGAGGGCVVIPAGSMATLFFGATDANPGPFYLTSPMVLVSLTTTPQGFAMAQVPIVLTAAIIGTTAFLQWMVIDGVGWTGFSESAKLTPL